MHYYYNFKQYEKVHIIEDATSGSKTLIKQDRGGGDMVTICPGTAKIYLFRWWQWKCDSAEAFAHLAVSDLTAEDDLIVADDLTLNSDSCAIKWVPATM